MYMHYTDALDCMILDLAVIQKKIKRKQLRPQIIRLYLERNLLAPDPSLSICLNKIDWPLAFFHHSTPGKFIDHCGTRRDQIMQVVPAKTEWHGIKAGKWGARTRK